MEKIKLTLNWEVCKHGRNLGRGEGWTVQSFSFLPGKPLVNTWHKAKAGQQRGGGAEEPSAGL